MSNKVNIGVLIFLVLFLALFAGIVLLLGAGITKLLEAMLVSGFVFTLATLYPLLPAIQLIAWAIVLLAIVLILKSPLKLESVMKKEFPEIWRQRIKRRSGIKAGKIYELYDCHDKEVILVKTNPFFSKEVKDWCFRGEYLIPNLTHRYLSGVEIIFSTVNCGVGEYANGIGKGWKTDNTCLVLHKPSKWEKRWGIDRFGISS